MRGRPLCVALAITVATIVLFASHESRGSEKKYQGERKILRCQVEEIAGQGSQKSLTVCDVVEETGEVFCTRMKLYSSGEQSGETNLFSELKIGNILSFEGEIYSFQTPGNPGQFNEYQYYQEQNIQYKVFVKSLTVENQAYNHRKQWLYELRTQLFEKIMSLLPEPEGGIVAAMVLGEKSALEDRVKELFQEGGIAHILAISG
ncbi:MAG: ComEC/Rec2 family competence protein, partial [Lachnospiraceae bacterium]|nr:ComEC/Rec2 family competence protein [Lachnospiraceae bacterium]